MTDAEHAMSEEPLQRMLERLDVQAAEMVGSYMDPIVLFLGFLGWGSRIWRLKFRSDDDGGGRDRKDPEPRVPTPPKEEKSSNSDGPDKDEEPEQVITAELVPADLRAQMPGHS